MSESASVEVLSADVRVIQVGNGQVTLSMYRQLDQAAFERFQPFGRVRDNERNPKKGMLQLVGRDTETGTLVRCDAHPPDWSNERDPLNMRIGCCTPSSRARTSLPAVGTGTSWSGSVG
jgi:hypothetical protein